MDFMYNDVLLTDIKLLDERCSKFATIFCKGSIDELVQKDLILSNHRCFMLVNSFSSKTNVIIAGFCKGYGRSFKSELRFDANEVMPYHDEYDNYWFNPYVIDKDGFISHSKAYRAMHTPLKAVKISADTV